MCVLQKSDPGNQLAQKDRAGKDVVNISCYWAIDSGRNGR